MNFLERLKDYWVNDVGIKPVKSVVPPKSSEPSEDLIRRCYDHMLDHLHGLNSVAKDNGLWQNIPKVKCPIKFHGWGYVEGRTEGAVINKNLTFFECDDDMGFTEYCVIINNMPVMTIYTGVYGTFVNVIDRKDFYQSLLGAENLHFETWEQFKLLPAPIKSVITDIAVALFKKMPPKVSDDAASEAILDYHFTRR
jgi:hypothetical protein